MKMLFIEDDAHKAERVSIFLNSALDRLELDSARSVQEGIDKLRMNVPDIVLLDMSLPIFAYASREQGFMHNSYAGEDILEFLDGFDIIVPVIVITAFDRFGDEKNAFTLAQLDDRLKTNYKENYIGSVWYNPIEEDWQSKLINFINNITD